MTGREGSHLDQPPRETDELSAFGDHEAPEIGQGDGSGVQARVGF
jgi:hypothetical protein